MRRLAVSSRTATTTISPSRLPGRAVPWCPRATPGDRGRWHGAVGDGVGYSNAEPLALSTALRSVAGVACVTRSASRSASARVTSCSAAP